MRKDDEDIQGYNVPREMVQEWADSHENDADTRKVICPHCGEVLAIITGPAKGMQVVCPKCGYSTLIDVGEDGSTRSSTMTKEQYADFLKKKNRNGR
ncbi:MAG: hypothetical protein LUD51_07105 [Clostridia bacterium]|nr:hypothetical protein [Clostridia bacterium]